MQDDGIVRDIERVSRGSTEVRESKPYLRDKRDYDSQHGAHPVIRRSNHGSNHNFSPKGLPSYQENQAQKHDKDMFTHSVP